MRAKGSLQARLFARLQRDPDGRALAFLGPDGAVPWRSFAQLMRGAAGAAEQLRSRGLRQGGVCVVALPSGESSALATLGALLLDALPLQAAPPSLQGAAPTSNLGKILEGVVAIVNGESPRLIEQRLQSFLDDEHAPSTAA